MAALFVSLVACIVVFGCEALQLPEYMTPCSKSDPKLSECALKSGREAIPHLIPGDPRYGVPLLDPILMEEVLVRGAGLTIDVHNLTVAGAKETVLEDIRFDFDKLTMSLQLYMPRVVFNGKYEIYGKLANLPITGKGDVDATFLNVTVKYKTFCNLTKKDDGEVYLFPYEYDMVLKPKGGDIHFGNLFGGNKMLGDVMNNFITQNFLIIMDEIGQPSYRALGVTVHHVVQSFAEKVPYRELFAD